VETNMKTQQNTTYSSLNTYTKLMRAAESVTSRISRNMTAAGLTVSQFGVLEALHHKGPLCQRDIATKILKSTGNITLVIDNLEKQELVVRVRSLEDRRYFTVSLTAKGEALISSAFATVEAAIVGEMSILTPEEQQVLGALCKKLGLRSDAGLTQ
jgi:MarR family transcriptional regulator, 2-MHQ and catechol-resistance regulon repressor